MLFTKHLHTVCRDKDGGGSGGGNPKGDPPAGDPPATGDDPEDPKGDPNDGGGVSFTPEQQQAIDKAIAERLKRAQAKWKADAEAAKQTAEKAAEQQRLKDEAKWKELAEKAELRIAELDPQVLTLSEQLAAYQATVNSLLEAKVKSLGDKAKTAVEALPGSPDALSKLNWLTANEALFAGDGRAPLGTPGSQGPKRTPKPAGGDDESRRPRIKF